MVTQTEQAFLTIAQGSSREPNMNIVEYQGVDLIFKGESDEP